MSWNRVIIWNNRPNGFETELPNKIWDEDSGLKNFVDEF